MSAAPPVDRDEQLLAELGYKQELNRSWSGFQNFAISFTIISILAGCFTTYYQAWNNGGPIAISWGWPLISCAILIIGLCMSELVSKYPTAGGIYWWASKLGGPGWGWFTGWFNLVGLLGVTASVVYASATFANAVLGMYGLDLGFANFGDSEHLLSETFLLFVVFMTIHTLINIFSSHRVAILNSISVWWHVAGVAVIIAVLIIVPAEHASFDFVFTERINNSGFDGGSISGGFFWFYVLPLGFLLTQYTITGFDSCAHISEETQGAAESAAKGVWRSIFYSALVGYILLLALTFAATNTDFINSADNGYGIGSSISVLASAMESQWVKTVLIISTVGQLFCGMACLTSASRMCFAFSRDGALPGWRTWSRVNAKRVPFNAVILMAVLSVLITLPALKGFGAGGAPIAFLAVVSIAVIGLYIAYVIPIYLRLRQGDNFVPGPWTLGPKYKWMCAFSVVWVTIITIWFSLPFSPTGVPWNDDFNWETVNYAPLMVFGLIALVGIWWLVSAKNTFTGPRQTITEIEKELAPPPVDRPRAP
jgi:amino acid transporter